MVRFPWMQAAELLVLLETGDGRKSWWKGLVRKHANMEVPPNTAECVDKVVTSRVRIEGQPQVFICDSELPKSTDRSEMTKVEFMGQTYFGLAGKSSAPKQFRLVPETIARQALLNHLRLLPRGIEPAVGAIHAAGESI
eukprot:11390722-Alexandrium_andersonii.AAC.1